VVVQTWSWRLANNPSNTNSAFGEGAIIYAQWTDVRRASSRSKYQMLPEQRVWRASELKADATKLLSEAQADEKNCDERGAMKTALAAAASGGAAASTAGAASEAGPDPKSPDGRGKASPAALSPPGSAKKTPVSKHGAKSPAASKKGAAAGSAKKKTPAKPKPPPKPLLNSALLFLKPEVAASAPALAMVRGVLAGHGLQVVEQGVVGAAAVASQGLVDKHYGAIAAKALKQKPSELVLSAEQRKLFEAELKVGWFDALSRRVLVNANTAEVEVESLKAAALKRLRGTSAPAAAAAAAGPAAAGDTAAGSVASEAEKKPVLEASTDLAEESAVQGTSSSTAKGKEEEAALLVAVERVTFASM